MTSRIQTIALKWHSSLLSQHISEATTNEHSAFSTSLSLEERFAMYRCINLANNTNTHTHTHTVDVILSNYATQVKVQLEKVKLVLNHSLELIEHWGAPPCTISKVPLDSRDHSRTQGRSRGPEGSRDKQDEAAPRPFPPSPYNLDKKFARCLAFLPRARSDGDSWYIMMQKVLLAINALLNDAFQGLEDGRKANDAVVLLLQPGKDPPLPLGGSLVAAETAYQATKRFWLLLAPRVSLLVVVPLRPLVALVIRVLSVDGSLYQQPIPLGISTQQAHLCSELPALHSCALDLLSAIIKCVRR
eukprot:Gb_24485 [translate_table: standard]